MFVYMKHKLCIDCKKEPAKHHYRRCGKCIYQRVKPKQQAFWKSDTGKASLRKYGQGKRQEVISFLGGCCAKCGFSDIRALQLDHKNGGGSTIRKRGQSWSVFYNQVLNGEHKHEIQVLCANCNWIKLHEEKEGFVRKMYPLHKRQSS